MANVFLHSTTHQNSFKMSSPRRSFFGSVKDKLSRKSSVGKSSKSDQLNNPFAQQQQAPQSNPYYPPVAELSSEADAQNRGASNNNGSVFDAPPPYTVTGRTVNDASTAPAIQITAPGSSRRGASPAPSGASAISLASVSSPEDPYAFLSSFDAIFLIDDSGSMAGRSWREVREALRSITPICTAHDKDGIDVYFLNARNNAQNEGGFCNIKDDHQVAALFDRVSPSGGTPTGTRINHILKPYLRRYEERVKATNDPDNSGIKPVNMIVITDGVPTDDPESVIISIAKKLDKLEAPPYQIGIQFFQVGNELGAREALRELDDGLSAEADVRDIVDTVPWNGKEHRELSGEFILKIVLGAVVKRLDRKRTSGESARPNRLAPRR